MLTLTILFLLSSLCSFPRGDPDGSQRLQRALALRAKWNSQRPGQGKAKRALSSAWDLSNVNGVNYCEDMHFDAEFLGYSSANLHLFLLSFSSQ